MILWIYLIRDYEKTWGNSLNFHYKMSLYFLQLFYITLTKETSYLRNDYYFRSIIEWDFITFASDRKNVIAQDITNIAITVTPICV